MFNVPQCCETGLTVFRPYPRRLESAAVVITKAALSSQLLLRP